MCLQEDVGRCANVKAKQDTRGEPCCTLLQGGIQQPGHKRGFGVLVNSLLSDQVNLPQFPHPHSELWKYPAPGTVVEKDTASCAWKGLHVVITAFSPVLIFLLHSHFEASSLMACS